MKVFFAIVAAVATLALAESLICNKCTFNLLGKCLGQTNETCAFNSSVCYTGRAKHEEVVLKQVCWSRETAFPSLPDFVGFNVQGCRDNNVGCNVITTSTLLGATYSNNVTCCTANNCNPITLTSGGPAIRMTFTSAVGGAILASVWGSLL